MSEHVALSVIKFKDGTLSAQPLHRGSEESCREVAELLSAISYSGPKAVESGQISIMPTEDWEALLAKHQAEDRS